MVEPKPENTFDIAPDPNAVTPWHPLAFGGPPPEDLVRSVSAAVMNLFLSASRTHKLWMKGGRRANRELRWGKNQEFSLSLTYEGLVDDLRKHGELDAKKYPPLPGSWLDASVELKIHQHAPCLQDETHLRFELPPSLGDKFPVVPRIDREGIAMSAVQRFVISSVTRTRERLVRNSPLLFSEQWVDWMETLFAHLNAVVSTVDSTMTHIYYKSKYDPLPGWPSFDEDRLGKPYGRRLLDKLDWVQIITGERFDGENSGRSSLALLKTVRNHIQHFDPPGLTFTTEDVSRWLNMSRDVASLLREIRRIVRQPLSRELIKWLLVPDVTFVVRFPSKKRFPQPANLGYGSCRWPDEIPSLD